jgi:hypothetical protein
VHSLRGDSENECEEESEDSGEDLEAYYSNRPNEYDEDCLCTLEDDDIVALDKGSEVPETLSADSESKGESKLEGFAA